MFGGQQSWRENRRFVVRHLREFGFGAKSKMEINFNEEMQYFLKTLDKTRENNNNEICIHQLFKLSSLNILWSTLVGERFSEDDEHIKYILQRMERTIANISIGNQPKFAFPFLSYIPGLTDTQDQVEGMNILHSMFKVSPVSFLKRN